MFFKAPGKNTRESSECAVSSIVMSGGCFVEISELLVIPTKYFEQTKQFRVALLVKLLGSYP